MSESLDRTSAALSPASPTSRATAVAVIVMAGWLLPACAVHRRFEYTPPPQLPVLPTNERVVPRPFDEAWSALINSVGKSFFGIQNFEKESGLITLTFNTSPFSESVDGGQCDVEYNDSNAVAGSNFWLGTRQQATRVSFRGNYADWIEAYCNGTLTGSVNLVVTPIDTRTTRIIVNTRFVVIAKWQEPGGGTRTTTWAWNSGDRAKQQIETSTGEQVIRIMQSAGKVETRLFDALDLLFGMAESRKSTARAVLGAGALEGVFDGLRVGLHMAINPRNLSLRPSHSEIATLGRGLANPK